MPKRIISHAEVLDRVTDIFCRYGYEGTSLSIVTRETGLGRASLYYHFPGGKKEMAQKSLAYFLAKVRKRILEPLEGKGPPAKRLRAMLRGMKGVFANGNRNCYLAAMSLTGHSEDLSRDMRRGVAGLVAAIAQFLAAAGIPPALAKERA